MYMMDDENQSIWSQDLSHHFFMVGPLFALYQKRVRWRKHSQTGRLTFEEYGYYVAGSFWIHVKVACPCSSVVTKEWEKLRPAPASLV